MFLGSVILTAPRVVKILDCQRSFFDKRRRVCKTVVEYRGSNGETYRRGFETLPGSPLLNIPRDIALASLPLVSDFRHN